MSENNHKTEIVNQIISKGKVKNIYESYKLRAIMLGTSVNGIADKAGVSSSSLTSWRTSESEASDLVAVNNLINQFGFAHVYAAFYDARFFEVEDRRNTGRLKTHLKMENALRSWR